MTSSAPGHAALRQTEEGCLALADISGYTSYLAGAELDHAQDVLEDLTETVVRALAPPMKLSKLEGDAAFRVPGRAAGSTPRCCSTPWTPPTSRSGGARRPSTARRSATATPACSSLGST